MMAATTGSRRFSTAGQVASVMAVKALLKDPRVVRLLAANTLGSIGSGITIFTVPWLLVNEAGGSAAYRHVTLATTVILFLVMPWYGARVDRSSRKTMVLLSEVFGAGATLVMAASGWWLGGFGTWQLMTIYFCGMFYYTLHYPAKWAMVQQIFDKSQYQSLTGLMEVQGQTAMLLAGALGGLAVAHLPLEIILLIDCATYTAAFFIQRGIPYASTHLSVAHDGKPVSQAGGVLQRVVQGWEWLAAQPRLAIFLTCSLMPFVLVMAGNYLVPVYVSQTLQAGPWIFAASEVSFALGAIAAGLILPRLLARHQARQTIPLTMACFLVGLAVQAAWPAVGAFLGAMMLLGFGNAGSRVARSSLMLHVVPNEVMGRITVFFSVLDRVLRTLLVASMQVVDLWGPRAGFAILLVIMVGSLVGAWLSREPAPSPPLAPAPTNAKVPVSSTGRA